MRPLRQKCGGLPIRRSSNHSRRSEQREPPGPAEEDRHRRVQSNWLPEARRRIGRAGPQAQSSVCFPRDKRIAWRITVGRFPDATRLISTWRTGAKWIHGARGRRPSKSCNGAINRKACSSCDPTRITSTSNGWCSSWKAAIKTRQKCANKVDPERPSIGGSQIAPIQHDFAGISGFHQFNGLLKFRVREAMCNNR